MLAAKEHEGPFGVMDMLSIVVVVPRVSVFVRTSTCAYNW